MSEFFRIVNIEGIPSRMSQEYGRQTADLIHELVASAMDFYNRIGYSEEEVKQIRERHEEGIGFVAPELIEKIRGRAEGAGVQYESLMDACLWVAIRNALRHKLGGCTTCLAAGKATATGGPIIGHNWDSLGVSQKSIVITLAKPRNGLSFITIGLAGPPGCEGMNEKGLTIVMSGVRQQRRRELLNGTGPLYVSPLWTHHILQSCSTVDEALARCKDTFRHAIHGENLVIGDSQIFAHVEIAYDKINIIHLDSESSEQKDQILGTTNHYASPELNSLGPSPEEHPNSYARKNRITDLLQSNFGGIDPNLVKIFLRDHHGPHPICRHMDAAFMDPRTRVKTVSSEIAQPRELRFRVAFGPPCKNVYRVFSLN